MIEQVGRDVTAPPLVRQGIRFIEQPTDGDVTAAQFTMRNVLEVTERVRVVQRPMFSERFPVVASLNAMKHGKTADVGAGEELAAPVKVEAPHVSTTLAKQLKSLGWWMVSPDALLEL